MFSSQTSGTTDVWRAVTIWKSLICSPPRGMNGKRKKGCFFIYIYGWFFGLASSLVATVYSFLDDAPAAPKFSMWSAVVLSGFIGLLQIFILTRKRDYSRRVWLLSRFGVCIAGLSVALCLTVIAVMMSECTGGLFYICGVFSAFCYFLTCLAFSARLYEEFCNDFDEPSPDAEEDTHCSYMNDGFSPGISVIEINQFEDHNNLAVVYNESDSSIEIIRAPQPVQNSRGRFTVFNADNGLNNRVTSINLPIVAIPSYADVTSEPGFTGAPPQYTEHAPEASLSSDLSSHNVSLSPELEITAEQSEDNPQTESPPEYSEIDRHDEPC